MDSSTGGSAKRPSRLPRIASSGSAHAGGHSSPWADHSPCRHCRCQTTGFDAGADRIVELGVVVFEYGAETGQVGWLSAVMAGSKIRAADSR